MPPVVIEIALAFTLLGSLLLAWWGGAALGRRVHRREEHHPQLGVVQGAILALLGLLLGFCFSGAMSRFIERQDLIVREANALGTIALRADLSGSHRALMLTCVNDCARARIALAQAAHTPHAAEARQHLEASLARLWAATVEAARAEPVLTLAMVEPVNELIDLHATHTAAANRHIPVLVLMILIASAIFGIASIGFGAPQRSRGLRTPSLILALLIAAALWTIIDLDFPRLGLVQLSDQPLLDAQAAIEPLTRRTSAPAPVVPAANAR